MTVGKMTENLCSVCVRSREEGIIANPAEGSCRLCEELSCVEHTYSYESENRQIRICERCLTRFKIPREEHDEDLLARVQAAVLGISTVYRCPQCHGEVRFRGFFEKIKLCTSCKMLVCEGCGTHRESGHFLCINCGSEKDEGRRLDAPPEMRCHACHAPVQTETDTRFSRTYAICAKCSHPTCNFCLMDSTASDVKTCRDCGYVEPKTFLEKVKSFLLGT